jgi:phosphoglycerate kinase
MVDFCSVKHLENSEICSGEKWLYVADFNVFEKDVKRGKCPRIDEEVEDLKQLLNAGAKVGILAHKGRHKDGSAVPLDFVIPYLTDKLNVLRDRIGYCSENNSESASNMIKALKPGSGLIMGNTRFHEGEEANDKELARQFAKLGRRVAVGGFGKAHRMHASNHGILDFLPGYATRSQLRQMKKLENWAGTSEKFSVAVLGGVKREKITVGLEGFVKNYDAIIPGGVVLNAILHGEGHGIGGSYMKDIDDDIIDMVENILHDDERRATIHIPSRMIVAKKGDNCFKSFRNMDIYMEKVPQDYSIVSYMLSESACRSLDRVVKEGGRMIVAGTPDLYSQGIGLATNDVLERLRNPAVQGIVLGGDTASEIEYDNFSTGGGSALYFAVNGTTPVFERLKEQVSGKRRNDS